MGMCNASAADTNGRKAAGGGPANFIIRDLALDSKSG